MGNSPINFNDPSGLIAADAKALAGKLGDSVGNWWDASAAGFQSESLGGFTNKVLQGLPVSAAGFAVIAKGTAPMASPASIAIAKSINSEAQVAQLMSGSYTPIAGAGTSTTLRDAPRLVAEYGGALADWAKVGASSTYQAADRFIVQTHAYLNVVTKQVVEFKSKVEQLFTYPPKP